MAGLDPAIQSMDGRLKGGHDVSGLMLDTQALRATG